MVNGVTLFRGISGQREVRIDAPAPGDIEMLQPDSVTYAETLSQDLACPGCGQPFVRRLWRWRCGACASRTWPLLHVEAACDICGAEARISQLVETHRRTHVATR